MGPELTAGWCRLHKQRVGQPHVVIELPDIGEDAAGWTVWTSEAVLQIGRVRHKDMVLVFLLGPEGRITKETSEDWDGLQGADAFQVGP